MPVKRISLEGFEELSNMMECPFCGQELSWKNIIGYGEYPLGGRRNRMKPFKTIGIGVECPLCFERLCYHGDENFISTLNDYFLDLENNGSEHEQKRID